MTSSELFSTREVVFTGWVVLNMTSKVIVLVKSVECPFKLWWGELAKEFWSYIACKPWNPSKRFVNRWLLDLMSKGLDVAALLQKMRNNRFEKMMFSSFVWDWVTFVIKILWWEKCCTRCHNPLVWVWTGGLASRSDFRSVLIKLSHLLIHLFKWKHPAKRLPVLSVYTALIALYDKKKKTTHRAIQHTLTTVAQSLCRQQCGYLTKGFNSAVSC